MSTIADDSVILLDEKFKDFEVGHFPHDYSPLGEYHYKPPAGYRGRWVEPTNRGWRLGGHWLILEDEGEHLLEQTTNTGLSGATGTKGYRSMILTGSEDWEDYVVEVTLQQLLESGEVGVMFRYRTGRNYYGLLLDGGKTLKLMRRNDEDYDILAECEFSYDCDSRYELRVDVKDSEIKCYVDGKLLLEATDMQYASGKVGLVAQVPARYYRVCVSSQKESHEAYISRMGMKELELAEESEKYPKPVLWRTINTKGFGTGRHIRFGDLTGDGRLEIVLAQNVKHHGIDLYSMITCLTAMDLDGNVLWQVGESRADREAGLTTSDVAFQIYDIDGDGKSEVILTRNFKIYVLDGRTGEVKNWVPTPKTPLLTLEECTKWPESDFQRINGDSIQICNFSGKERPSDLLVKNRYNHIWVYDENLELLWEAKANTGHFPQPYDFDGDGRDELMVGYTLFDADGKVIWDLGFDDHVDEIAIGKFNPEVDSVQIALTAGDEGFIIVSPDGEILHREMLGHAQRVSAAKFREDMDGLQFYLVTFWDNPNIISLHDCRGEKQFSFESSATGNILSPVNWCGDEVELALLSGSTRYGGMIDGFGRRVVIFPDDGHPDMCSASLDLMGDARDEIVLWDQEKIYIYTQDRPFEGEKIYRPVRYPHYNDSNYRAEISLPEEIEL